MEEQDLIAGIESLNRRQFRIRGGPFFPSDLLLLFSVLLLFPPIFRYLFSFMPENNIKQQFLAVNLPYMAFFIVGLILLLLFTISVLYVGLKHPESNFRIKQEIKRVFYEKILICKDKKELRQYLFIFPKIETDKNTKCKIIHLKVNSPRFTEQSLDQIKNIHNFRNAQSVEIEPGIKKNGRQSGYKLSIFYESEENIFNNNLERL